LQMRHTFWGMGQEEVQASMGPILGALGLKFAVFSDDEALARISTDCHFGERAAELGVGSIGA
jgi:hypothetical protein